MKRRIILVTDSLEPSGMGENMLTLGTALADEFDVLVAASTSEHCAPFLLTAASRSLRIKSFAHDRPAELRRWLKAYAPDLVHVHAGIGWEGHGLVRTARAIGVPVIRTEHLPDLLTSVVQQAEYRAMLLSVDQRIAVSKGVADSYRNRGGGRMTVVLNGIAPRAPSLSRKDMRARLGISLDETLVITIARFTAQKGHEVLLAAVPSVLRARPKTKFALVGSGPEREAITSRVSSAGLEEDVLLLGPRTDVPDLLAAADLFVLPSLFEGLPLAVLEAMAARVPIVATAIGGVVEALGADHGHLVAPGDPEALAQAILGALADPDNTTRLAQAASRRFAERFVAQRMCEQTAQIYRALLTTHTSKVSAYA